MVGYVAYGKGMLGRDGLVNSELQIFKERMCKLCVLRYRLHFCRVVCLFYGIFNDAISSSEHAASNDRMMMVNKLKRTWN